MECGLVCFSCERSFMKHQIKREELAALHNILAESIDPNFGLTVEVMRNLLDAFGSAGSLPADVTRETVSLRNVPCERLAPLNADQSRAILFFHSGGYSSGSLVSHASLVAQLAFAANCVGYLVDYRLAPEHPFPAAIDDAWSAYQGLLEAGISQDRIAVAGSSAGGALAVAITQLALNNELGAPACLYVISPWLDLTLSGRSYEARAAFDPINQRGLSAALAQSICRSTIPATRWHLRFLALLKTFPKPWSMSAQMRQC
jgi:acetyl esterase/lipase